jgi:hypothetical protein
MPLWHLSSVVLGLALVGPGPFRVDPPPPANPEGKVAAPAPSGRLAAIPDWDTFFLEFRRAVRQRDTDALQSAMDEDFFYTFQHTHKRDARDQAVRLWEQEGARAWVPLEQVLRAGSREDPVVPGLIVSPPAWISDERYTGYRAGFTKVGPYWRWIWFVSGDG